jgi:cellulose synthase/poly-beta-1,6-N-acetylglucosamine synthase-like glycosyltransferase
VSWLGDVFCGLLFFVLVVVPSLYGFHMYLLMFLAHRRRRQVRQQQRELVARYTRETPDEHWPRVTTQLPLYNEMTVARRVIEAAARMDYPRGRHEVQVLDDSTDGTREIVDRTAAELRAEGYDVHVIRRPTREHYKAGALAYGLHQAHGELIAIFDADFIPDHGFLRRMVPLFSEAPDICVVQGRWGHLNAEENWLTQALSLGLDLHFAIEQGARCWNGLLISFNGTGGLWRRAAIDDPRVGGWSGDTITEDLDLSYRAQLAGWRMVFCMDEVSPAELPADVNALKAQQRRWAIGTIQTARKLLPAVWRSSLTMAQKLQATVHMTQYAITVPMILVALIGRLLPLMLSNRIWPEWVQWLSTVFLLAALAPCIAYMNARFVLTRRLPSPLRILKLVVLGLGLCVNNGLAVLTGLVQRGGEFVRTPKSGSTGRRTRGTYGGSLRSHIWLLEVLIGTFCLAQWLAFLPLDGIAGSFLLLYAIGLIALGWGSRPEWIRGTPVIKSRTVPADSVPLLPDSVAAPAPELLVTTPQP